MPRKIREESEGFFVGEGSTEKFISRTGLSKAKLAEFQALANGGEAQPQPGTLPVNLPASLDTGDPVANKDIADSLAKQGFKEMPKPAELAQDVVSLPDRMIRGAGENILTMGTGMASLLPAGVAGVQQLMKPGPEPLQRAATAVQGVQQAMTYVPQTETGQKIAQGLGQLGQLPHKAVEVAQDLGLPWQGAAVLGTLADVAGVPEGRPKVKFYSALDRAVAEIPRKVGNAQAWKNELAKAAAKHGFSAEEMLHRGVDDLLAKGYEELDPKIQQGIEQGLIQPQQPNLKPAILFTKDQIVEALKGLPEKEYVYTQSQTPTFESYFSNTAYAPGSYEEVVVHSPTAESFSGHFTVDRTPSGKSAGVVGNFIAAERPLKSGEVSYGVLESQSDLHSRGRKQGYRQTVRLPPEVVQARKIADAAVNETDSALRLTRNKYLNDYFRDLTEKFERYILEKSPQHRPYHRHHCLDCTNKQNQLDQLHDYISHLRQDRSFITRILHGDSTKLASALSSRAPVNFGFTTEHLDIPRGVVLEGILRSYEDLKDPRYLIGEKLLDFNRALIAKLRAYGASDAEIPSTLKEFSTGESSPWVTHLSDQNQSEWNTVVNRLANAKAQGEGVPLAIYKDTAKFNEHIIKRVIANAVENANDVISWQTGDTVRRRWEGKPGTYEDQYDRLWPQLMEKILGKGSVSKGVVPGGMKVEKTSQHTSQAGRTWDLGTERVWQDEPVWVARISPEVRAKILKEGFAYAHGGEVRDMRETDTHFHVGSYRISKKGLTKKTSEAIRQHLAKGGMVGMAEGGTAKPDYHAMVAAEAQRQGVDPHLARAVMLTESNKNPNAVSHKGALGLMQLMPATAKELGVDPTNPEQNIKGGVQYLKQNLDRFGGDTRRALLAYNAGPTAVGADRVPQESHAYADKVLATREKLYSEDPGQGTQASFDPSMPAEYSQEPASTPITINRTPPPDAPPPRPQWVAPTPTAAAPAPSTPAPAQAPPDFSTAGLTSAATGFAPAVASTAPTAQPKMAAASFMDQAAVDPMGNVSIPQSAPVPAVRPAPSPEELMLPPEQVSSQPWSATHPVDPATVSSQPPPAPPRDPNEVAYEQMIAGLSAPVQDLAEGMLRQQQAAGRIAAVKAPIFQEMAGIEAAAAHAQQQSAATIRQIADRGQKQAQALVNDILASRVNPEQFWADRTTGQKIMGVLGIMLGTLGQAGGGPNIALQVIDNAIARDIDAQKANINVKQSLVTYFMNQTRDLVSAEHLAMATAMQAVAAQLSAQKSRLAGLVSVPEADFVIGQLMAASGRERLAAMTTLQGQAANKITTMLEQAKYAALRRTLATGYTPTGMEKILLGELGKRIIQEPVFAQVPGTNDFRIGVRNRMVIPGANYDNVDKEIGKVASVKAGLEYIDHFMRLNRTGSISPEERAYAANLSAQLAQDMLQVFTERPFSEEVKAFGKMVPEPQKVLGAMLGIPEGKLRAMIAYVSGKEQLYNRHLEPVFEQQPIQFGPPSGPVVWQSDMSGTPVSGGR